MASSVRLRPANCGKSPRDTGAVIAPSPWQKLPFGFPIPDNVGQALARSWDQYIGFASIHDLEIDCPYKVVRYQAFLGLALDGLALCEHDL